jgi:hypothetical protein
MSGRIGTLAVLGSAIWLAAPAVQATPPCLKDLDFYLEFEDTVVVEGRVSRVETIADGVVMAWSGGVQKPLPIKLHKAHVLVTDLLRGRPDAHSFSYEWRESESWPCENLPVRPGETWVFTLSPSRVDGARKIVRFHSHAAYQRVRATGKLRKRPDVSYPIPDRPETPND